MSRNGRTGLAAAKSGPLVLTRAQIVQRLQWGAQQRLGLSAEAMVGAYRAGRLPDPGAVADLLALAHLLTEDDPLFVPA